MRSLKGQTAAAGSSNPWSPREVTALLRSQQSRSVLDQILKEMKVHKIEFDVYHCSAAISSYKDASMWPQALWMFQHAQQSAIHTADVCHLPLSSWASGSRWMQAVGFLTSIAVPRTRQPYALSATLSACAGAGAWQVALALMQEFSADVMCYNSLISACGKGGQWILAMAVLHEMMLIRLPPSNATFSAAISACEKAFRWQEALALLQQALGLLRPELSCLNAMLSACEKGQRWDLALHLLKEMPSRRLVPDRISFNAVLSACAASSIWTMALHLFNVMPSKRLHPGQITRNAVITACEKALQWQIVLELLHADGLNDLSGSGTLHHAAWYLSKQIPSSHTKRQAIQLARQATVKLPDFKVQEHLGLHRWQRCLGFYGFDVSALHVFNSFNFQSDLFHGTFGCC